MDDIDALRRKAARIRLLAQESQDGLTTEMLLALAIEIDAKIAGAELKMPAPGSAPAEPR
jgi:hypothetical protein